jgi:undecaprenyl-diphosphatase
LILEAVILGIIQGITEFLPVSSTAHLILVPWFFNWSGEVNTLTFDVALHAGTLLSLLFCFWKDWIELIAKKQRLFGMIVLASIPAGLAGFFLNDLAEQTLRSPLLISMMLIVIGVVMLMAEKAKTHKGLDALRLNDAMAVGIAQSLAIIPGVSRSGITISTGLFRGVEREASARFSFLLSTPIIAGAAVLHFKKAFFGHGANDFQLFAAGLLSSFVTGIIAIKVLLAFLKKHPLNFFAYYRFVLAVVIIAGIWLRG